MGAWDYTMNAIQAGQISTLQDRVAELESKIEEMSKWIMMLKEQNEILSNQLSRGTRTGRNRDVERRPDHRLVFPILGSEND